MDIFLTKLQESSSGGRLLCLQTLCLWYALVSPICLARCPVEAFFRRKNLNFWLKTPSPWQNLGCAPPDCFSIDNHTCFIVVKYCNNFAQNAAGFLIEFVFMPALQKTEVWFLGYLKVMFMHVISMGTTTTLLTIVFLHMLWFHKDLIIQVIFFIGSHYCAEQ